MKEIQVRTGNDTVLSCVLASSITHLGDERLNYPILGKENEYHTSRLDVENAKTYDKENFAPALEELYSIVKQLNNDDNKNKTN